MGTACRQAESWLERGEPLRAYDIVSQALSTSPDHVRLRQLQALALARSGAPLAAREVLERLVGEGAADEETLGLLARTHKDAWASGGDVEECHRSLRRAYDHYAQAFARYRGTWSGINAATLALLLDQRDQARELARDVRGLCLTQMDAEADGAPSYWTLATLGEAALVLGDRAEGEAWYTRAATASAGRFGDIVSTRRNARLVYRHLGIDGYAIEQALRVPPVVACAGHLIDRPGRLAARFPPSLQAAVRDALRRRLASWPRCFGFASAACGADLLFLEEVTRAGGETTIVLPYSAAAFVADSVDIVPGADWVARFEQAVGRAHAVITVSEHPIGLGSSSFEYGLMMLDGLAAVRADELETDFIALAVWDGKSGDGQGGTADAVARWRRAGRTLEIIDLEALRTREGLTVEATVASAASSSAPASACAPSGSMRQHDSPIDAHIVSVLFADVKGFSRLAEPEIPLFVEHFLGRVADVVRAGSTPPLAVNTWGDGLYFVFAGVQDAGECALRLCEHIAATDWCTFGISSPLGLRVGLHAGPAYRCVDPLTGRANFLGSHVSRAARIEPITPPGHVYASGEFAALAHAEGVKAFTCSYVGQTPLAKGYGTMPTFAVRRRASNATGTRSRS
ncbi:MAG: TRAFs-binding domain-containing protein [Vicinamibacterales bacterium]